MTARHQSCIIVSVTTTRRDGTEGGTNYGPFLPHAGSATSHFVSQIRHELEENAELIDFEIDVQDVFIGADEADCEVISKDQLN